MEGTSRIRRVSVSFYLTPPPDLYTLKKRFNGLLDTVKPSRGNAGLLTAFSHAQELIRAATDAYIEERAQRQRVEHHQCSSARIQ